MLVDELRVQDRAWNERPPCALYRGVLRATVANPVFTDVFRRLPSPAHFLVEVVRVLRSGDRACELARLVRCTVGEPMPPRYGSAAASIVSHDASQLRSKLDRGGGRVPQFRMPPHDRLAYELVPARRP